MKRRDLIKLAAASLLAPGITRAAMPAQPAVKTTASAGKTLVLVQLKGGNDGLNTFIPTRDELYYQARPILAIPRKAQLTVTADLAFHPALKPLLPAWEAGQLKVVQNVGYEHPNLSHFRSTDIWHSGSASDEYKQTGWLAGMLPKDKLGGIVLAGSDAMFRGSDVPHLKFNRLDRFTRNAAKIGKWQTSSGNPLLQHYVTEAANIRHHANQLEKQLLRAPYIEARFTDSPFGNQVRTATEILASGYPVSVIKLMLNGFDTHAHQAETHARLLAEVAGNLAQMRDALTRIGRWNDVQVMTYSEFGRRVKENGNLGTDHGAASALMMMGGRVDGGMEGSLPELDALDARGNLRFGLDYRGVFEELSIG